MARKKGGGAWGNALGGFRKQKRNASGQFGAGVPTSRGMNPSFQSGGTPRYYAPGGKTYATKSNGFVKSQGSSTAKQARRKAGIDAAIAKKNAEAKKKSRNKKIIAGVAVGALVLGGAVAYQKSGRGSGDLKSLKGALPDLSRNRVPRAAQASPIPNLTGRSSEPNALMRSVKDSQAGRSIGNPIEPQMSDESFADLVRRQSNEGNIRAEAEMNGVTGPRPSRVVDDGFSPASSAIVATAAGGAAVSLIKSTADLANNLSSTANRARRIDQDGVSAEGRHVPEAATMPRAYADHQNLASVIDGTADNRYSVLSHKDIEPGSTNDSWEKELAKSGVVMKDYGKSEDQYGERATQEKRAPMEPGVAIGSGHANVMDMRLSKKPSAQERREFNRGVDELKIGPNAGRSTGENVRSTHKPVKLEAADRTARQATGNRTLRKWTGKESEQMDARIMADRQKKAEREKFQNAGGVVRSRAAFSPGKGDHDTYNQRGKVVGRTNEAEDRANRTMEQMKIAFGPDIAGGAEFSEHQQMDLDEHLGFKNTPRSLVGQPIPGSIPLKAPTAIAKTPQGEINAEKYLESIEKKMTGGQTPDRFERQMAAFLRGDRPSPPKTPSAMQDYINSPSPKRTRVADFEKKEFARKNRNARARAAKAAKNRQQTKAAVDAARKKRGS